MERNLPGYIKPNFIRKVGLMVLMLLVVSMAKAATITSTAGGGNWSATATWVGAVVPLATDAVVIASGATVTVDVSKTCASLTFAGTSNGTSSLVVNSGLTLTVTGTVTRNSSNTVIGFNTSCSISGAGTLSCSSVQVGTDYAITTIATRTTILTSTITNFNITGNLTISSFVGSSNTRRINSTFNLVSGTVNVDGFITTTNENAVNTSTFNMASGVQTGTLFLSNTSPFNITVTGTSNITLSGTSTLVNYDGAAQTVRPTTYTNLTLSGSGAKTTTGATVNGVLSMEGTATTAGTVPGYGAAATLQYKGTALQTIGIEFPATFAGTGGVIINNAAGVNLGGSVAITNGLTLTSGSFAVGANTLTLNGPAITGTTTNLSTINTSSLVFGGNSAGVSIPSSVTQLNNLTINNANGISLNGPLTINGALTLTSGALNLNGNTLTISATGSFTCGGAGTINGNAGSTFVVNGATATNLPPGTYQNLTINRTGGVTLCGNTTINGILTLTSGAFAVGVNTLTLNGPAIAGTPNNLATTIASTLIFGGSSAGVTIPSSVAPTSGTTLLGLTINNTNGVSLAGPLFANNLTLTAGVLNTTVTNLLTITNTGVGSIGVSPGSYITGPLARTFLAGRTGNATYLFPVGDGANYRPLDLVNVTTGATTPVVMVTESGTGATTCDETTITGIASRNWKVQVVSGNYTSGIVRLTENGLDATKTIGQSGAQTGTYTSVGGTGIGTTISTAAAISALPAYFAIGTSLIKTYYSYQSGDWNLIDTWTIDPSGSLWINAAVPTAADKVVILNGRTVSVGANSQSSRSLEIRLGGTLDLRATTLHNFGLVSGQGLLRLSSGNFPAGTYTDFVSPTGGTVEYYNFTGNLSTIQTTYNNLLLTKTDNSATNYTLTLASDLTLNGNLTINRTFGTGTITFTIGDSATPRNIAIEGNLINSNAGCFIGTPNIFNVFHNLSINGDFTNNGTIKFTNQVTPDYTAATTTGAVIVSFPGVQNSIVNCNGTTNFYQIVINKGTDMTYMVSLNASALANFGLYGPCNFIDGDTAYALSLQKGTVRIGTNIDIRLADGTNANQYIVYQGCQLWVDGGHVLVPSVCNQLGVNGKFRISSGSADFQGTGGIHLNRTGGVIQVDGGTLTARVLRSSITAGDQLGTYTQSGGAVILDGNLGAPGSGNFARLAWWKPENQFIMSGGTITVRGAGVNNHGIDIRSYPANVNITGGTIIAEINDGRNFQINSTAPFWNLQLIHTPVDAASFELIDIWDLTGTDVGFQPLVVKGDLRMGVDLASQTVTLNTNNATEFLTGDFVLGAGSTFNHGLTTDVLTLNGPAGQRFNNAGNLGTGLYNLVITNKSNTDIVANNLVLRGSLTIDQGCFLNDVGHTVSIAGNITNAGTHTSQGTGGIILNGAAAQTIGGSGSGVFGNFAVNKVAGTSSFTANQSLTGNLRLGTGILDINRYNLKLSAASNIYDVLVGTPVPVTFGNAKMIRTSGQQSDGGLTKAYNAIGTFLYPLGTGAYHPATIAFSQAPTTWGDVTIKPVALVHPFVITGNAGAMKYYWKVTSNGFTGIQPGSVSHTYQYVSPADVVGIEANYITGIYKPYTWTTGATAQVDKIAKKILFPSINILDGDYTAGVPGAFGLITVYYSRVNGDWGTAATWSTDPVLKHAGAAAVTVPTSDDAVVIGDGVGINHVVTIYANNKMSGGLQINLGSTLDLQIYNGHNFGALPDLKISGSGTLRIASSYFPSGDFGNFLGPNGGTTEYYTETAPGNIGAAFILPTTYTVGIVPVTIPITSYYNLILSPATGKNITLPNTDLTIFNDLSINVSGTSLTGITRFNNQNGAHTLSINGNLNVNKGNLQFTNPFNVVQNVIVNGDVTVSNLATFNVATAGANVAPSNLSIQGNLVNNGVFNMKPGTSPCNVTFMGVQNKQISGTGAQTDFNILTVNKGADRNSILDVTASNFSLNTALPSALTLTNGTFRLTSPLLITLTSTNAFTIPASGCLSANGGTINIGVSNSNTGYLSLLGRLEVLLGNINIGTGLGSNHDIEYAAAGNPEIIVSGGNLTVDGQIRRSLTNTLGSLWFNQSGGTILLKGINNGGTRGTFELLNTGSQFNVSGGNLIVERSGSTTYADIYIVPDIYNVTNTDGGHTLTIGDGSTPVSQTFKLNSSAPLWNLTVDGTTNDKTASLSVNTLSVLHDLTINGAGSVFLANELDVTIGGSLINNNTSATQGEDQGGYQSGAPGSIQNTTFTGAGQITGTGANLTNFANLVIGSASTSPVVTLSPNSNLLINNNLTLTSGTLSDAGNTVTVMGDIYNAAVHTSPAVPGGGIVLSNGIKQVISGSGNGQFGNITMNNPSAVHMIDNCLVTGQLSLLGGLLYIDDYLLTMDVNATFNGSFDANHMVVSNGVVSDKGVQKLFSASATNFVFPIGTSGKYRPVTYTFTSANPGSITLVPVSQAHPADFTPATDQLNYYWKTTITGFSGATGITQVYQYGVSEVSGTESSYHGARYTNFAWNDYGTSVITLASHTITVSDLLSGDYTAGEIANFTVLHKLYSKMSGNWTANIWAEDSPSNPLCGYYPIGNPVFIQPGHIVTMNIIGASAASVDIEGTLDLRVTTYHNLGVITDLLLTGTGKLKVQSTTYGMFVFPGGNYDQFMTSPGTTVELYGTTDAQMPLKPGNIYKPYQNLIFTDTGIKYMSAENLKILGNLIINSGATLNNTLFNKDLIILGNWTDFNSVSSGFVPGTGLSSFEGRGSLSQLLTVAAIPENFYNFRINNPVGVTLAGSGNVQVTNNLTLVSGAITTNATNSLTLTNPSTSAVIGGSVNSFINGPLRKQVNNGSFFTFPVGKSGSPSRYGNIYLSSSVGAGIWEAEYYNADPTTNVPSLDKTSTLLPINQASSNEYWRVNGVNAGSAANVTLRWDGISGYIGTSASTRSKIRLVEWNVTQWVYRGKILNDGGPTSGTVTTDNSISLATPGSHWLTIGNEGLPTATISSPLTASICNDGVASATVIVTLTGTAPWTLSYKLGTVTTTLTNIASSPVSIVLTSNSPGITQPISSNTVFNFNITNVNDFTGIPGISDYSTIVAVTVKPIPDNTITGKTIVGTGEVVAYTTPSDASTYLWSLSSNGTAPTNNTPTYTITWDVGTPGPYTISLTKTSASGCTVTNSTTVTTSTTPTPVITGSQKVCAGSTGNIYSTPYVALHSYTWTITAGAGTVTAGAGTNSVTITWNSASVGNSVNVHEFVTATPGVFTDASLLVDIGLQPSATIPVFSAPTSVCNGNTAAISINGSENGVRYQLRLNSDNSFVGAGVDGTGGTITLNSTAISSNTIYNTYAYTLAPFNCSTQLTNPSSTFTITALATLNYGTLAAGDQTICNGSTPNNIAFTSAPSGGAGTFTYQWYAYTGLAGACPSGTSVPGGWTSIGGATLNNYTPPSLSMAMSYAVLATPTGSPTCGTSTWASGCRQVTVTPTVGTPTVITVSAGTDPYCQLTNGTTTTTYVTTATNSTGFNWSLNNGAAGSIGATTGIITWANGFWGSVDIRVTANGCNGPSAQVTRSVTVIPNASIASVTGTSPLCVSGTTTYTANSVVLGGSGTGAWSSSNTAIATVNSSGLVTGITGGSCNIIYTITGGCGGTVFAQQSVTITTLPSATISYAGSPFCTNFGTGAITLIGTSGGTYSSSPAGLSLDTSSGAITTATSAPGSYTITYTLAAAGGCGVVSATTATVIRLDGSWLGGGNDWNTTGNWDCGAIPSLTTDVTVANGKTPYPILSGGSVGTARNLTIGSLATLMITGNKLQIAGNITISSPGPIDASAGIIEMNGGTATIPANTFAGNNLKDLIISNGAGVTLDGTLNLTGILSVVTGNLASGGFLNLISSATQTAMIDGSGSGQVTGNVTMQRYLSSGFGYKYFSSPFSNVTVAQFSTYLSSDATISKFYRYDENQRKLVNSVWTDMSGWADHSAPTTNLLDPMVGYAANLGSGPAVKTVSLSGTVHNGGYSVSLSNNNRTITKGFNLVGNPYPSPIDWDASSGWTKSNVDNAIYFFNAIGGSDQYSGVYNSWVGGVSTGGSNGLIPSMQGFFVHVTSPGTGSLDITNSARTNDLNPTFKAASVDPRPILRFTACFDEKNSINDAFVLYFDPSSTPNFDSDKDALKLINTDVTVPNLYSITPDVRQLSINGMPSPVDSLTKIPLGIKILKDGWLNLSAKDISMLPADLNLYLLDKEKNVIQDLKKNPTYRFYLNTGEKNQRFALLFAKTNGFVEPPPPEKLFTITKIDQTLLVNINLPDNEPGKLYVTNMLGQIILEKEVSNFQLVEISTGLKSGIYIVTMTSGLRKQSEKIVFLKK